MDRQARGRSSLFSESWPVSVILSVATAACGGQTAPEEGVASVGEGIRGGTPMDKGGIDFAVKIDQAMSDGKRLLCSGAFVTPHVVLTAAHCTRNYDYGSVITPTADTMIRYGSGFADSQKIAGGEKVGWRELGSTDIGLYRVAGEVTMPVLPKIYRRCNTVDLVGERVVAYGRMVNGNQAPAADYYMSPERVIRGVANGIGANGNYLQIDSTTDAGDSGGPWVYGKDRIVAVTHSSTSRSDYGSRVCDVVDEIEAQVKAWGDELAFVEDSAGGGANGGEAGASGKGGASNIGDPVTAGSGGADPGGLAAAGGGMGRGGAGAAGAAGRRSGGGGSGGAISGGTAGGVSGQAGSGGAGPGVKGTGAGGASGADAPGSGVAQAGGRAGSQAPSPAIDAGSAGGKGGANAGTSAPVADAAVAGREPAESVSAFPNAEGTNCGCVIPGGSGQRGPAGSALLMALLGFTAARRRSKGGL